MHTAEPKLGCCNKNIWLLTFTTQSNSGSQCCLVTMAHYWPYLRGHKNVWRSPPLTPSTSSPPAFAQSFLQPHNNLRALIAPLLRVASSQGPSILYTPPNPAGQLCGGYSLPRSSCLFLYRKGGWGTWKHLSLHKNTMLLFLCTLHACRTQQIQRWWAWSGRLEGCRLHAMKLIDSCKNRGTQSSAKETEYRTARWVGAPAFIIIFFQSGFSLQPAVGGKQECDISVEECEKMCLVGTEIQYQHHKYSLLMKAICQWEMRCIWSLSAREPREPGSAFLIGYRLGDAHPN